MVDDARESARELFEQQLQRLHFAVKQHWRDERTGRPSKIAPAIVKKIHVSAFAFSRGATEARAFVSFLVAMCKCDARLSKNRAELSLGGFELVIDFLGIFDTVASIGIGNTFGNSSLLGAFDGHAAWADAETVLRVPEDLTLCKCKAGSVTDIMREQRQLYIQWRLLRRAHGTAPLDRTESFGRASQFDQNDLHSANLEFEDEIKAFEEWPKEKGGRFTPKHQKPGFDDEHSKEWEEIASWWDTVAALDAAAVRMFDEYVHDSRAWFKMIPGNPDSEEGMRALLMEWCKVLKTERAQGFRLSKLSADQQRAAQEFARTERIPAMLTAGREPFNGPGTFLYQDAKAGYLRYRKVYAGGDRMLISDARRIGNSKAA